MMSHSWYMGGMSQGMHTMPTLPPMRAMSLPPSPSLPPMYPSSSSHIPPMHMPAAAYQQPSFSRASSVTLGLVTSRPSSLVHVLASPRELNPSRFPSRDINLMSPSTIVTPIQPSPGRPASVRAAMQKYTCDFQCGFMGGYEEVSLHERICDRGVRPTTLQSTPEPKKAGTLRTPQTPINAMSFNCDFGCGFVGSFKQVEDHERNCKNAPRASQLSSVGDLNERRYQAVEMHEKACDKRPGAAAHASNLNSDKPAPSLPTQSKQTPSVLFPSKPEPAPTPQPQRSAPGTGKKNAAPPVAAQAAVPTASPPAPGLEQHVYYCHHMCGFKGNFQQVDAHEKSCTTPDIAEV